MSSILKREFAPISDEAWKHIDAQAVQTIRSTLTCRRMVDFKGPYGWDLGAVNIGRLDVKGKDQSDVYWGVRTVQPLIEIREPFHLKQMELDNFGRGAEDVDLEPLIETAIRVAQFEDRAVYHGFEPGCIVGIGPASAHKPQGIPKSAGEFPGAVAEAVRKLIEAGIGGPYHLVLGTAPYFTLFSAGGQAVPPFQIVREMLAGGEILLSRAVQGGLLLSGRGGDFELTVGKDLSIGYADHTRDAVELFIAESFTFRVLEPKAAVAFKK